MVWLAQFTGGGGGNSCNDRLVEGETGRDGVASTVYWGGGGIAVMIDL